MMKSVPRSAKTHIGGTHSTPWERDGETLGEGEHRWQGVAAESWIESRVLAAIHLATADQAAISLWLRGQRQPIDTHTDT